MDNKIENLLNVSLDATPEELSESAELAQGYDFGEDTWELIVKYQGDLDVIISRYENVTGYSLLNNFAVLRVPSKLVDVLAENDGIQYIDKPKRLFFDLQQEMASACILPVKSQESNLFLSGKGVLVGIVDSGIDIFNRAFRNDDGTTRIRQLWDQSVAYDGSNRYGFGRVYDSLAIDEHIAGQERVGVDENEHGSRVAAIACGNSGVASGADIVVVKLARATDNGFPGTTQLMAGIDYIVRLSLELNMPAAINVSIGNNYGSHRGDSLLEQYIDMVNVTGKCSICVGAGNESGAGIHKGVELKDDEIYEIELVVGQREPAFGLQVWKYYWDDFRVELVAPNGEVVPSPAYGNNLFRYELSSTRVLVYLGEPGPYSIMQELYYDFIPGREFVDFGIWKIRLTPVTIKWGRVDLWLPARESLNYGTAFLEPDSEATVTVPATAQGVISVGAYDSSGDAYATFSGRGFDNVGYTGMYKPDVVAPGVEVDIAVGVKVTGTSFAAPFVTGSAALLMEWGIVKGNDPYLYGEKVKAYLIKGARPLRNVDVYPNSRTGWGALCLKDSIP